VGLHVPPVKRKGQQRVENNKERVNSSNVLATPNGEPKSKNLPELQKTSGSDATKRWCKIPSTIAEREKNRKVPVIAVRTEGGKGGDKNGST